MNEVQVLLAKYRTKGILIDTNILLLYLVGLVNRERITQLKQTTQLIPVFLSHAETQRRREKKRYKIINSGNYKYCKFN